MECVYGEYINFVNNFLINYYKSLLGNKYDKNIVKPFIEKYIGVRYYNDYTVREKDFTERLNKELNNVAKALIAKHKAKAELIKNSFALFSYVLFIDGCTKFSDLNLLLKSLFEDENITLEYSAEAKKKVTAEVRDYISKKVEFFKLFNSGEFYLKGKKLDATNYSIDLGQKCNMSKLYSDYAINRAYDSEVVYENRIYLALIMLSSKILSEVLALEFNNNYIVSLPSSLFEKQMKLNKLLRCIDDEYLKEKISLKVMYKDYKKCKKQINALINQGYSMSLELDDSYSTDFENLFLFSNIIVDKQYKYYDIIIKNKSNINTNIITV